MKNLLDNALRVVKDVGWQKGAYVCGSEAEGVEGVCLIGALGWAYEDALDMAAWKEAKENASVAASLVNDVVGDGRVMNEMYAVAKAIEMTGYKRISNYEIDQMQVYETGYGEGPTIRMVIEAHRNDTPLVDMEHLQEGVVDWLIDYIAGWNDKDQRTLDDITMVLKDAERYLDD